MADPAGQIPEDVVGALGELAAAISVQTFGPASASDIKSKLVALGERVANEDSPVQTETRKRWHRLLSQRFHNTQPVCYKPTRTGTSCQHEVSPATGGLTCPHHSTYGFPFSDEGLGVRHRCCADGCSNPLTQNHLGCQTCTQGICDVHYAEATQNVEGPQFFQGSCAVCYAQNPDLADFLYLLSTVGEPSVGLLIFYNERVNESDALCNRLETCLETLPAGTHITIDPSTKLHFPPRQPTPLRRGRAVPPNPGEQTPAAGFTRTGNPEEATGEAPAHSQGAPPPLRTTAAATLGLNVPTGQTAEDRNANLLNFATANSINPNMTVTELMSLLQGAPGTSAAGALLGTAPALAGTGQPALRGQQASITDLVQRTGALNLNANTAPGASGANLPNVHPSYNPVLKKLESCGVHESGDLETVLDLMGFGATKLHQHVNQVLHGFPRVDASDAQSLFPGKMAFIYNDEGGHAITPHSSAERQFPSPANFSKWNQTTADFLRQLPLWRKGVYVSNHPLHSHAIREVHLLTGINAFIPALIHALTQVGYTFKEAYMTLVYLHRSVFAGLTKSTGSELQNRMIEIGSALPTIQPAIAAQVALFMNTSFFTQAAVEFVRAAEPKPKDKPKDKGRDSTRERPDLCSLCKKPGCPGYNNPTYLCTNPIKSECRLCNFRHARTGKRKSPCGANEPAPSAQE